MEMAWLVYASLDVDNRIVTTYVRSTSGSARARAERLTLSLPAVLDAADVLQNCLRTCLYVRPLLTRRAHLTVVDDILRVLKKP